ncbi:MAG: hypothetical protein NWF04_05640 [Candidatus Bathyarchaeota archaeon]|nr:hypothetical protein [Candidatus Bathyarchaeota archaeon]
MRFDILMPSILFIVTLVATFLSTKAETKLKATVEERELQTRDTLLMAGMIAVAVSIVVFIPSMAILALFLFSYSSLLFTVSYTFSDMKNNRLMLYCGVFIIVSIVAGAAGFLGAMPAELQLYGTLAFAGLATYAFAVLVIAQKQGAKQRWYLGALAPALFLFSFFFFSGMFSEAGTPSAIWFPYLVDVYGILFAILIVVYLSSLFSWKTVFIFGAALTIMDIILVWVTGTMLEAAEHISGLGLPVLVAFPTIPFIYNAEGAIQILMLGLGDFFFSGILITQTYKRYGKKIALIALAAICISFGIFELTLINPELSAMLPSRGLPATLPIILGWLPVVGAKMLAERGKQPQPAQPTPPTTSSTAPDPAI